ncbi:tagaturonate epimerase family protein [Saccharicrinis sp. FJH62]|uniref:tagaturonate epimerase family protein n=1 Tax=Saccharicrinis sp. FJH62 TaxID=3344657 RepID=UPI0035D4FA2B
MKLVKYSMGVGDRFGQQGKAQLKALMKAHKELGLEVAPVWNKSNREHQIIGTQPDSVRTEADNAVKALGYDGPYYVDADHINAKTVHGFIASSDFFTLDVADFIGEKPEESELKAFVEANKKYVGDFKIPGIDHTFNVTEDLLVEIGSKFLFAVKQAKEVYTIIKDNKGDFIAELSMDEVDVPQTPLEMFFILSAVAAQEIPIQTIAPKFTGDFFKGIDYVGDIDKFTQEFEEDILVLKYAVKEFGLPENIKLSVHSGSDKFSIYPIMGKIIKKQGTGIHIKTAGTTWLEEVIGLAIAGEDGLAVAKEIYRQGYEKREDFMAPYRTVIDINEDNLPSPDEVDLWSSEKYANTLRHDQENPDFNLDFRQLIHISYKIAAKMGDKYLNMVQKYEDIVGNEVTTNIFDRHIMRVFNYVV